MGGVKGGGADLEPRRGEGKCLLAHPALGAAVATVHSSE